MKSPWHLGFLALAVTGVSTYDFMYFKNYKSENQTSIQMNTNQPATGVAEPLLSPLPEPANIDQAAGLRGADSLPRISREELSRLSQQAFISKDFGEADVEASWPGRDPFAAHKIFEQEPRNIPVTSLKEEPLAPLPQPAPQYIFSGTLIEGEHRFALVDGSPLSIGDRLGIWQLARIEPDYIILEAGKEIHRIQLKGAEPQVARQKDPS